MTPKVKIFGNVFPYCSMGHGVVSWPNLVEIGGCEVAERSSGLHTKNLGSTGLDPAPILPKMGRSCPKFPERCHPLTCPRILNLAGIGCVLLD